MDNKSPNEVSPISKAAASADYHTGITDPQETAYPSAVFTTIDDYCLLQIFQYLNLYDSVNLASTCAPLHSIVVTLKQLVFQIDQIGPFVEEISFTAEKNHKISSEVLLKFGSFLQICANLQTLRINNVSFNKTNENVLHKIPLHLKGLHLVNCSGVDYIWTLRFTELLELIVTSYYNNFNHAMFKHCKQLAYLDLQRPYDLTFMKPEQIEQFFESNSQIKTLKLKDFGEDLIDYAMSGRIAEKLQNLESLTIVVVFRRCWLSFQPHRFTQLKILYLDFVISDYGNPLLRILSECGEIEELTVRNENLGYYADDLPLILEKLKKPN